MGEELSAANAAYQEWSEQQRWETDYASFLAGWVARRDLATREETTE